MPTRSCTASRGLLTTLALILGLAAAGCANRPGDLPPRPERIPTLTGQEKFFDGQITTEVRVGAMAGFRGKGGEAPAEAREGRRGPPGGFGGGMGGGPGMRSRGEGGPEGQMARPPGAGRRGAGAPSGPPVMIHLKFTNHGTEPVELHIVDFLSPLGNFVVQPEKLTLAPGASAETEPMSSGLAGQVTGGNITLKLRIGDRRETKIVRLQTEPGPDPENGKPGQSL